MDEKKENEDDKDNNNKKKEMKDINENINNNQEILNEEIKTKVLNSKNDFLSKMKNLIEEISKNYDNLITNLEQNGDKDEALSTFNNLEEIQNNILEENKNLNIFLKNQNLTKKEEKDDKILKIKCNSDIEKLQKKIENKNYEKIIIKELPSTSFNEIFKSNTNKKYNDIIIKKTNIENYNLNYIKDINKLKIKKCKVLFTSNFINFNNINELYLESLNLFNDDLNIILQELNLNLSSLKIFSLKNNFISKLNLIFDTDIIYDNLEFINLSSNKISKITKDIFEIMPNIKSIDLTNNNINFICRYKEALNISKNKKCILLLAKNPAIIIEKNREEYCNYLKDILPEKLNDNSHIKNLNLEGLFINKTYSILSEIDFNRTEITQLNSLDLSHNNLNDKDFIKLIEKNKIFFAKIKKLILCSNYITEEGINSLINNNEEKEKGKEELLSNIFNNLKKLNLSGNPIKFTDLNQFKKMINFFPNLNTLLMKHTPFETDFNNYLKYKALSKNNKENQELPELDSQFEEILEKEKFFKGKKINIKMMNTNDYEYYISIRKYFPYLLFNFNLENNFNENDSGFID